MNNASGFLLTMPGYHGTLAAARCLGSHDVPTYVASSELLAPAAWSRHIAERFACPAPRPTGGLLDWLVAFGKRHPGHVLYATSDDLAWLFAAHAQELGRHFRLYTPPLEVMHRVLDKQELYAAARAAGISTPATAFPVDGEIESVVRRMPHPVLIKPRTQALLASELKGEVVSDAGQTTARYRAFVRANRYEDAISERFPDIVRPMLQEYSQQAAHGIYSLSGFCGQGDDGFVVRAAVKVLQWPRRVGVGICFEDAPVDEELAARLRALCARMGYYGVFEAEFIQRRRDRQLIDFNPRFFGQMGFDVARGLPAPYLAYLGARGERAALRQAIEQARAWHSDVRRVFVNRVVLESSLLLERLVFAAGVEEAQRWREWQADGCTKATDAHGEDGDPLPAVVGGVSQLYHVVRHPRSVLRSARSGV